MNVHTGIENIEKKILYLKNFLENVLSNQQIVALAGKLFNFGLFLLVCFGMGNAMATARHNSYFHAQLGLADKGRAIKELVACVVAERVSK